MVWNTLTRLSEWYLTHTGPCIVNYDEGRGVSVEVPYLHVVSPSEDWLISPQFNTDVAPFLNLQWRRRFANGMVVVRGGYTYERNFGDFDLDGDEATLTGFRVTNGSKEDLIGGRFGDLVGNEDDMTITYSQEAVRVEGTAQGEVDGTERKDIPFVMDVGCTTWMGLTNEGDVAPPS